MKPTTKSTGNTSFHDSTIVATVNQLKAIMGEPTFAENYGDYKVNFEWDMETETGDVFTVYDWKEYRKLPLNQKVCWHIGGKDRRITEIAKHEITLALCKK